ncbi:MAG: hypothetical protein K2N57_05440 [Clostridia bacterium]|nr:hypothetical protein [Clostridia bacterium]
MQTTNIDIQIIKNDVNTYVDTSTLQNVIYIENALDLHIISQITLSGQYNSVYNVVSHFIALDAHRICVDNDILLIALYEEIAIVDLKKDKIDRVIKFNNCWGIRNFCKFKSGYFVHGEGVNYFLNKNFDVLWNVSSIDIFVNMRVKNDFEIQEDYIAVYDWYGNKHYYNENGEFDCTYYPQLNCDK